MYTSSYVYDLGYADAKRGKVYRDSVQPGSRYRPWLDEYERGWSDARDGKTQATVRNID